MQWKAVRLGLGASLFLAASACHPTENTPVPASPATSAAPGTAGTGGGSVDWAARRGQCVEVVGYAGGGAKTGPLVQSGRFTVDLVIDDPSTQGAWDAIRPGSKVRVRGTVGGRDDRPVFISVPGEPPMQGIPVPPGTDLEKARHRWVIAAADVTPTRPIAGVERDLTAQVGKEVSLSGVVRSVNGHFWFNHDGVDVHIEGQDTVAGWTGMHGEPITLKGTLERKPLPRIDQIVVKEHPDLADAFLLHVRATEPHPDWAVTDCPKGG